MARARGVVKAVVSNFDSGIILLIERPVKEGDVIEVAGQSGKVRRISVRATHLETSDGQGVIIPNANLITGVVRNMTLFHTGGRITLPVSVTEDTDLAVVNRVLADVVRALPMVKSDPAPQVLVTGFGPGGLNLDLVVHVVEARQAGLLRSGLHARLLPALRAAGVRSPHPVQTLRVLPAEPATEA